MLLAAIALDGSGIPVEFGYISFLAGPAGLVTSIIAAARRRSRRPLAFVAFLISAAFIAFVLVAIILPKIYY